MVKFLSWMKWLLVFGLLIACAPSRSANTALDHLVTSGTVVLVALDSVEAERLSAIEHPTEQDLGAARERVARLRAARDALDAIDESGDLEQSETQLALVASLLRQALDQAERERVPIPPEARQALRLLEAWVESGASRG
jgi:Skp family chaperone for outer membrane proteins